MNDLDTLLDVLVIGADSRIGGAVIDRLTNQGVRVFGTTRRPRDRRREHIHLDLGEPFDIRSLPPARACLIAAAITSLEACENDPRATARINVDAVARLADDLAAQGCFTLLLSTNQVFPGEIAHPRALEPTRPMNAYGKQKERAERKVLKLDPHTAVLRLSKVMEARPNLFRGWAERLSRNESVQAFSNMVLAPLPLGFTVDIICRLLMSRQPGIFQASGDTDIDYHQVAEMLADRLGVSRSLVEATSASDAGLDFAAPKHTTLDMSRLHDMFQLSPPSSRSVIEASLDAVVVAN